MMIEQLDWKTVWDRTIRRMDPNVRHRASSAEKRAAFQCRLTKLSNVRFVNYGRPYPAQ